MIDEQVLLIVESIRNPAFDLTAQAFTIIYSVTFLIAFILAFYILNKNKKLIITTLSLGAGFLITYLIKIMVRRPRPLMDDFSFINYAFPSGHTISAFIIAVLSIKYFPKYKYLFFVLAVIVGFSRIYLRVHYLTDIIAGAIIGSIISFLFLRYEESIISFSRRFYLRIKNLK